MRADSTWDVPEPEVAIVVNAHAEIVGYTIGNDVSSRSIEGDNPLYLPQAKVYDGCCALGPGIMPGLGSPRSVRRSASACASSAAAGALAGRDEHARVQPPAGGSGALRCSVKTTFPDGVILSTGTALVPDSPFTLEPGDDVEIEIDGLGSLRNPVVRGKGIPPVFGEGVSS